MDNRGQLDGAGHLYVVGAAVVAAIIAVGTNQVATTAGVGLPTAAAATVLTLAGLATGLFVSTRAGRVVGGWAADQWGGSDG